MHRSQDAFANLSIWERVGDRMSWYLAVASNRMPAKYLISRRVPCELDLGGASEEELWREHEALTERFLALWHAVRRDEARLSDMPAEGESLVDLSAELARRMLRHCNFCRWNCRVDRIGGTRRGACQLDAASRVSSYFHHLGEELVFRGTLGSGTIFFTSCNLRCQFCQNGDISHDRTNGIVITPARLAAMAWELRVEGCHNINWVGGEPTANLHTIVEAIGLLGREKPKRGDLAYAQNVKQDRYGRHGFHPEAAFYGDELNAPMLWNSNFFMSEETLRLLRPLVDVWLPDFKFGSDRCSVLLSKTPWYFETVSRNHQTVYDWGEDVVIRHLIMPDHVGCCTRPVLRWIAEHTPQALVNVMDQYHPDYACDPYSPQYDPRYRDMARRPYAREIREAYAYARELGLRFEDITFEEGGPTLAAWPWTEGL
jgi:putative pyruvate formate lyase activating enzyme